MRSLQDALYNWLTIKVVVDARPDDQAALDTVQLFESILRDDYQVEVVDISKDDMMYYVTYTQAGEKKSTRFPIELIDVMLNQINEHPERYRNFPI
ncbi:hypothetical protein [Peribacillus tepidiphilus]|jgi:hypothetical protein|uniref:hypothetical protein n=1 Tax=Peribacillus tepidiphilus TaxID=2652445 RepID=UPI0012922F47|nr:hypothetical protein [Peribacillus tepidiphilus]